MPISSLQKKPANSWRNYQNSRGIKKNKPKKQRKYVKKIILIFFFLGLILLISGFIYIVLLSKNLPNPNQLIHREVAQSTKIYDRTGQTVLYEISGNQRRTLVTLNNIPNYVKEATIAIEDKDFYKHGGFSVWSMFRTAITDVLFHRSAGGSTLTQQFIKNAVLTSHKTISRKVKELVLAYRLEQKFSKNEILQMYLNEIPYGSNAYGVEAASQNYFGKSVESINLAEAAILASIIQMPSYYSPYGPHKDLLLRRKDYVLNLMFQQNYISKDELEKAKAKKIKFKEPGTNIIAPHFVMYIKSILAKKYGEQMIEQGGLKIYTTLDLYKQKIAEEAITTITKNYPKRFSANNAALVAINPKNGQILSMVGSRDYFNDEIDGQFNVATSPRQPGSSMKPIVYAALFEKGYTPNTILYDVNTNFSTNPNKPYNPKDYDLGERGPVSIRKALSGSLNIPAVKAMYLAGTDSVLNLADNLGYTTLHPRDRFGLSFVLGGAEVKLLEHVNAYSALARDGQLNPIVSILKVIDNKGKIIEEYKPKTKKVLDSQVVRMIDSILIDNQARSYVFGSKNFLNLGDRPVAAKTGTTNGFHDAWTIGFTPSLVTGVWVGNNNNKAMNKYAEGSSAAAPIWHYFMKKVLGDTPIENFQAPQNYQRDKLILNGKIPPKIILIDKSSRLLATSSTPPDLIEKIEIPIYHNILYYLNKNNPLGPAPKNPEDDPQFNFWEKAVQNWVSKNASSTLIASSSLPTTYDNLHKLSNKPILKIIYPLKKQTIRNSELKVTINASAPRGINRTQYYINNNIIKTLWGPQNTTIIPINFLNNGYQTLKVKTCDDVENCSIASINFNLSIANNKITTEKNDISLSNLPLKISSSDFPLSIALKIKLPIRTVKVDLIIKKSATGTPIIINSLKKIQNTNVQSPWLNPPEPGNYLLWARLYDWNGSIINSKKTKINILP